MHGSAIGPGGDGRSWDNPPRRFGYPGCAKVSTYPAPTGSTTAKNTIEVVCVTCCNASRARLPFPYRGSVTKPQGRRNRLGHAEPGKPPKMPYFKKTS